MEESIILRDINTFASREILSPSRLILYYVKNDIEGKLILYAALFIELIVFRVSS